MTILDSPPVYRLSVTRRVLGVIIGIVLVADVVAYGSARLFHGNVFLRSHYGNFLTGLGVLLAALFVGSIVVFPIRNSVTQRARPFVRFALLFGMLLSLIGSALCHGFDVFTYAPNVVATSPNGHVHAALVNVGRWEELHLVTGSGVVHQTDVGSVGAPCELNTVSFADNNTLVVELADETVRIPLDPATGAPTQVLQRNCNFQ